jgi:hypothetical protein
VCPGFVKTTLTAKNDFTMPALITPTQAAGDFEGWAAGAIRGHFPKRFTLWMKALSLLPRWLCAPVIRKFTGL